MHIELTLYNSLLMNIIFWVEKLPTGTWNVDEIHPIFYVPQMSSVMRDTSDIWCLRALVFHWSYDAKTFKYTANLTLNLVLKPLSVLQTCWCDLKHQQTSLYIWSLKDYNDSHLGNLFKPRPSPSLLRQNCGNKVLLWT